MNINRFGEVSLDRVRQMEARYGVNLPEVYRNFLIKTNGGTVSAGTDLEIMIPQLGEPIYMETFYGLDLGKKCFDIDSWMDEYRDELPPCSVLIGDDKLKGFLLLICSGDDAGVYYWDDAFQFEQSNEENNAYLISKDFQILADILSDRPSYLPLGSVVLLKGGTQKLLVIARAIRVKNGDKLLFFDYGGVPYPQGLVNDRMAYFNADGISRVVFEGYRDVDDANMVDNILQYLEENPDIEKGDASGWNTKA